MKRERVKTFFKKRRAALSSLITGVIVFVLFALGVTIMLIALVEQRKPANAPRVPTLYPAPQSIVAEYAALPSIPLEPIRKDGFKPLMLDDAESAVVLDVDSGILLYGKNPTEHRSIASVTKILTAMVVIDRERNLDRYITVPQGFYVEGTKVGCRTDAYCTSEPLQSGEELRMRDLLDAMLLASANDAAHLLAIGVSGSVEEFVKLMNLRVVELGLTDSNFCLPSGLELDVAAEQCYSSAYDIARVIGTIYTSDRYMQIREILKRDGGTFTSRDGTIEHRIETTNKIFGQKDYIQGTKTGYTYRAGASLALAAQKPGTDYTIVSVVLGDLNRFDNVQMMTEWAFDNFEWY